MLCWVLALDHSGDFWLGTDKSLIMRAYNPPPKLTTGQIYNLCALAVLLGAGGNVPGGSMSGTASLYPSEDTLPIYMPVPDRNDFAYISMNEDAAKVETPLSGLAVVSSLGDCVGAVSKVNK